MWSSTKIVITYSVIFNSFRMLIGATSSIYLLSKGVSLVDLGLMKTMQASVFFILDIPTSYLADRISRKYAIALSVFFWWSLAYFNGDFIQFIWFLSGRIF
ncbi:hypothetical protein [Photorhabdus asymbiotica]|uniref:hypothetical protein n=1 Tax=Photorhabdus asymbiotica TaxID=291112 RepID=UPI003DA72891